MEPIIGMPMGLNDMSTPIIIASNLITAIPLGRAGENDAYIIQWLYEASDWKKIYGSGTMSLLNKRPGETEAYPVAITVEDDIVSWLVTSADTAIAGYGQCELQYRVNDVLVKSQLYKTKVLPSIGEPGDVPEAYQGWVNQLLDDVKDLCKVDDELSSTSERAVQNKKVYSALVSLANRFSALENPDNGVEIKDDWETIIANCDAGLAPLLYSLGMYKSLKLGDTSFYVQIIGVEVDDLADGSGKAPLTWRTKYLEGHFYLPFNITTKQSLGDSSFYWNTMYTGFYRLSVTARNSTQYVPSLTGKQIKCTFNFIVPENCTVLEINFPGVNNSNGIKTSAPLDVSVNDVTLHMDSGLLNNRLPVSAEETVNISVSYTVGAVGLYDTTVIIIAYDESGKSVEISSSNVENFQCDTISLDENIASDWYGVGINGGWEYSWIRRYLQNNVMDALDEVVRNGIKPVKKGIDAYYGFSVHEFANDTIFVPSYYEMIDKATYQDYFNSDNRRIMKDRNYNTAKLYQTGCWGGTTSNLFNVSCSSSGSKEYIYTDPGSSAYYPICFCT